MKNCQTQNVIYQYQYFYLYRLVQSLNLWIFFRNLCLMDDSLSADDMESVTDSDIDIIPIIDFFPTNEITPINTPHPINDTVKKKTRKNIIEKDKWCIGDSDIPHKIHSKDNSQEDAISKCKPPPLPKIETDKTHKKYKSPLKKLVAFFRKSRDEWKKKCLDSKYKLKITKHKVKRLESERNKYKNEIKKLKNELYNISNNEKMLRNELNNIKKSIENRHSIGNELFNVRPARHSYSVGDIKLFLSFVLDANTSFRGTEKVMKIMADFFKQPNSCPCWNTGRSWLLRLGYYKLTRPKKQGNDWALIMDHTIQIGNEKCLGIMGVQLCNMPKKNHCLSYKDLEPIALYPVTKSNGDIVYNQLEEVVKLIGIPRVIVADHGSDLKVGIEKFCDVHNETEFIYDIKHKIASLLKHELSTDEEWLLFSKLANKTKKAVQQTALAFLEPPNQKTKARYMNVGELIQWGRRAISFLEAHRKEPYQDISPEVIQEKIGWIQVFTRKIEQWDELFNMMKITENFVKHQGLYRNCEWDLSVLFPLNTQYTRTEDTILQLIEFVSKESLKPNYNERFPGSSEVLESCFGKQKELEKSQSKSGFTVLLLGLAAMVSETTDKIIQTALETVPTKKVIEWYKENFGESVQSKKQQFRSSMDEIEEQKWNHI